MTVLSEVNQRISVRYSGRTFEFDVNDIELPDNPTNGDVLRAAQEAISEETGNEVSLTEYEVEQYVENGLWVIHPQAKFG